MENQTPTEDLTPTPTSIVVPRTDEIDANTTTSELGSELSSKQCISGESRLICDWVRKGLFKYCKFITSHDSMDYGQELCLFALEENNITSDQRQWWSLHKKTIINLLNEKRGCVVESIKNIFKSKYKEIMMSGGSFTFFF